MLRRLPLFLVVLLALPSYAYIPAVNSTAQGVADTENSTIDLKWPSGTFQETISYQLAASASMGISKVCPFPCRSVEPSPDWFRSRERLCACLKKILNQMITVSAQYISHLELSVDF